MSEVPLQPDEVTRLSRLAEYQILDSSPETLYDRIVRLACLTMNTPMAAVGLLDARHIWLKASVGIDATSIPRKGAFCTHLLGRTEPLIISDTHADPTLRDNPMVCLAPYVRYYVGVPLVTADGVHVGSLCTMDRLPRPAPAQSQIDTLRELAALAMDEMELRRVREGSAELLQVAPRPASRAEGMHRNLLAAYAAKSEFLSSLSHELRTPLNAIVGYAGLIASSDDSPRVTADHAGEIIGAARHMLALVNDILEYSRLEAGNMSIGWRRVVVRPIVDAALHMVAVFATSRGIILVPDIAWPDAVVRGDPVRLKQVLLNLLTNAIKFTPRGGHVTVRLARGADDQVEISVADTGIGIAEADIPKTLTPFGQIVPKEGAQTEGTGLGLPIAKALIERQGGTLSLESQLGLGTTARIFLPSLPAVVASNGLDHGAATAPAGLS